MNNIMMYVITHKKVSIPQKEGYYSLLVGSAQFDGDIDEFDYLDDAGENISGKNPNYCELTGLYWIWKNSKSKVVGISHYRRFFTRARFSSDEKYFLNRDDLRHLMKKYELVVPKVKRYSKKYSDAVNIAPNKADLTRMRNAIKAVSPEYMADYEWFLNQNTSYLYNMCIMRKNRFDDYCEWLFPILFYIEEHHDLSTEDDYRKRLLGFLSERLLLVWAHHNIQASRIYKCRVKNTDQSLFAEFKSNVHDQLRNIRFAVFKK